MKIFFFLFAIFFVNQSLSQDLFTELNHSINKEDIVASIDTLNITAEEFFYNYEFGPAFPKRTNDSKSVHLKYLINEKLLALEGYQEGLTEQDYEKNILKDIQSDLAAEEMFVTEILPKVEISEDEVQKIIQKKTTEFEIRWLYTGSKDKLEYYLSEFNKQNNFDSLFNAQLNDTVSADDRKMKSSLYNIYLKNPLLAQILDTLKAGTVSAPIHTDDGWYVVKIDNIFNNLITTETEQNKLRSEAIEALKVSKMGALSDNYVKELFDKEQPVIKRDAFNFLRSYLGKFILPHEKYAGWELDRKLDSALAELGLQRGDKYPGITLVAGAGYNYLMDDFIHWYDSRKEYIKFATEDLSSFSRSLESFIWVMVRDKMLANVSFEKGYDKDKWVKKQCNWWEDKIAYSSYKNELRKSVSLKSEELNLSGDRKKTEVMDQALSEKILHKLLELKKEYKISINKDVLDKLKVSSENDKKAIDMYIVKRGNLFPRPAFPSIDNEWGAWE